MIRLSGILIAFVLCNLRDSNDTHPLFLIQARVYFSSVIRDVDGVRIPKLPRDARDRVFHNFPQTAMAICIPVTLRLVMISPSSYRCN